MKAYLGEVAAPLGRYTCAMSCAMCFMVIGVNYGAACVCGKEGRGAPGRVNVCMSVYVCVCVSE